VTFLRTQSIRSAFREAHITNQQDMKCNSYRGARKTTIIQEQLTTSIDPTTCSTNERL